MRHLTQLRPARRRTSRRSQDKRREGPPEPPRRSSGWLGLRVTFSGLLYTGVLVLICLAALHGEANLLLLLFGIGLGILALSPILATLTIRRLEVERVAPMAVVANRSFTMAYVIRNPRRWSRAWAVSLTEIPLRADSPPFPQAFVPVLRTGQPLRVELTGCCPYRTRYELRGIRVTSRFPFGLFACSVDLRAPAHLTVYPTIGRLRLDPWTSSRYAKSSAARAQRDREEHEEFFGVREYRPGDNYRQIHWRRSAHTGQLIMREMMPLRQTRLIVMIDPWPAETSKRSIRQPVSGSEWIAAEQVISAAATIVCEGLERGHRVGLICRSRVPRVIATASGRGHRQRLLEELAALARGADVRFDDLISGVRWSAGWNAHCMLLAARHNETHDRVARFLGARAEVFVALCPGSESFHALFDLSAPPAAWRPV